MILAESETLCVADHCDGNRGLSMVEGHFSIYNSAQSLREPRKKVCDLALSPSNLYDTVNNYSTSARRIWNGRFHYSNETCSAELAIIISYPTSASGRIVLLKTPTKYREFFPTLFVKTTDFQLVLKYEHTRTVTIFGEHGTNINIQLSPEGEVNSGIPRREASRYISSLFTDPKGLVVLVFTKSVG